MRSYLQFPIDFPLEFSCYKHGKNQWNTKHLSSERLDNFVDICDKNSVKFVKATVGNTQTGLNVLDKSARKAEKLEANVSIKMRTIYLNNDDDDNEPLFKKELAQFMEIPEHISRGIVDSDGYSCFHYTLLRYNKGDFFVAHKDGKHKDDEDGDGERRHIGTILVYPPSSFYDYEGGELYLSNDDITIKALEHSWSVVFLNIDTLHEVKPITKGTRYVLKSEIWIPEETVKLLDEKTFKLSDFCKTTVDTSVNVETSTDVDTPESNLARLKEIDDLNVEIREHENAIKELREKIDNIKIKSGIKYANTIDSLVSCINAKGRCLLVLKNLYYSNEPSVLEDEDKVFIEKLSAKLVGKNVNMKILCTNVSFSIGETVHSMDDNGCYDSDYDEYEDYYNDFKKLDFESLTEPRFGDIETEDSLFYNWDPFFVSDSRKSIGESHGVRSIYNDSTHDNYNVSEVSILLLYM